MPRETNAVRDGKLLGEVKEFFTDSEGADSDNRLRWTEDMQFCYVPGSQWDQNALARRAGRRAAAAGTGGRQSTGWRTATGPQPANESCGEQGESASAKPAMDAWHRAWRFAGKTRCALNEAHTAGAIPLAPGAARG